MYLTHLQPLLRKPEQTGHLPMSVHSGTYTHMCCQERAFPETKQPSVPSGTKRPMAKNTTGHKKKHFLQYFSVLWISVVDEVCLVCTLYLKEQMLHLKKMGFFKILVLLITHTLHSIFFSSKHTLKGKLLLKKSVTCYSHSQRYPMQKALEVL